MKTITVTLNPACHVPDYAAFDQRVKRFLGRKWNPQTQTFDLLPDWVGTLPLTPEYRQHLKDGSLIESRS